MKNVIIIAILVTCATSKVLNGNEAKDIFVHTIADQADPAAEIVQEQQRHVGDDDANAALRFFFTTLYETQTETDSTTVTSTATTFSTCFTTEAGIEPCRRRNARDFKYFIDDSRIGSARILRPNPTRVVYRRHTNSASENEKRKLFFSLVEDREYRSEDMKTADETEVENVFVIEPIQEVSLPEIELVDEPPILPKQLPEEGEVLHRQVDLDPSNVALSRGNWVEREVIGIRPSFDPNNIAHRFLTVVETRHHFVTETSTTTTVHPEVQRVVFGFGADGSGCLPDGISDLIDECSAESA